MLETIQSLEARRLFAIPVLGGVATINGTGNADVLEVVVNAGILQVRNAAGAVLNSVSYGSVSKIVVNGGGGNDFIRLGRGDGTLAPSIRTTLSGDAGNDTIIGGKGGDVILGGANDDKIDGRAGADLLDGGAGFDTADYSYRTVPVRITLTNGSANDGSSSGSSGTNATANDNGGDNIANCEAAIGGSAADRITGNAGANWLDGGGGNDTLFGGPGIDTIIGGVQNDLAFGEGDNDTFLMKDGAADQFLGTPGTTFAQYDTNLDSPAAALASNLAASAAVKSLGASLAAAADDGQLTYDTTFGENNDGKQTFSISGSDVSINDVALQADGKIVAVGRVLNTLDESGNSNVILMRFEADGTIDRSFGTNGIVITDFDPDNFNGTADQANSVVIDSEGRILIAGNSSYDQPVFDSSITVCRFIVGRYLDTGELDTSFADNGRLTLDPNDVSSYDTAARIVVQRVSIGDGFFVDNYLVAGTAGPESFFDSVPGGESADFVLCRLDESGNLDFGFGPGGGFVLEDFGNEGGITQDQLSGLNVDPANGDIWLTGDTSFGDFDKRFSIVGYTSSGENLLYGKNTYGFDSSIPEANVEPAASDAAIVGKTLVVVGTLYRDGGSEGAILAVSIEEPVSFIAAALDAGDSVRSVLSGPDDQYTSLNGVSIDADGNAVATGGIDGVGYVYRFNPEDLTVVGDPLRYDFGETYDEARAVVVQPDGKYLVAGVAGNDGSLVRLTSASDVWVDVNIDSNDVHTPGHFTYVDPITGQNKPVPTYLVWRYTQLADNGTWMIDGSDIGQTYEVYQKDGIVTVTRDGEFWQETAGTVSKVIINAGGGNDTVKVASGFTLPVVINAGSGNDSVYGGNASDDLNGEDGNDLILGFGGNDTLRGGAGRDILIGGDGRDSLKGEAGEDVLIAGITKYDSSVNIQKIADEWNRTDLAYAKRVKNLVSGGGKNGAFLLNAQTVFSLRSVADIITGGNDLDAFWGSFKVPGDMITDRVTGEVVTA